MYVKSKVYKEASIVPTISPEVLFARNDYQDLLNNLKQALNTSDSIYNELYKPTIFNYVRLIQCLPDVTFPDKLWIQVGIERSIIAVRNAMITRSDDARFVFAVFTASLFIGLGRLVVNYQIGLCDKDGFHKKDFNFLDDGWLADSDFFRSRPLVGVQKEIINPSTIMLAYKVIDKSGLVWILENSSLYVNWLNAITHSSGDVGGLNEICELSENVIRRKKLKDMGLPVDVHFNDDLDFAEKFWLWLCQGVKEGGISINTNSSLLHVLASNDIFISDKIFKAYIEEKRRKYSSSQLIDEFKKLGLARMEGDKFVFAAKYNSEKSKSTSIVSSSIFSNNKGSLATNKLGQNEAGSLYSSISGAQASFFNGEKKGVVVSPGQLLLPLEVQKSSFVKVDGLSSNNNFSLNRLNKAYFGGINQQQF